MKENKEVNEVNEDQLQKNEDEWQYEFADKMIESWPAWKKEIYETNYSGSRIKKVAAG